MTSSLEARFVAANVSALGIHGPLRAAIESAEPRGKIVTLADGTTALEVGDKLLGAVPDARAMFAGFSNVTSKDRTLVVVFGVGAGHAVRELRERTRAHVVVYEPDPAVLRAVLGSGPTDLGTASFVSDLSELQAIWPHLAKTHACATLIVTPGYAPMYPEELAALREAIPRFIADVDITENTRVARFREWVRNYLENVRVLNRTSPVLSLGRAFEGVPAFVVGAGPSLGKNAEQLRLAKRKGIVIAVDVACKALAKMGIEPDVVVCLEGLNLSHHLRALPFIDTVVRCFSLAAHPESLKTGRGPLLPFYERLPQFSPIEEIGGSRGASVGGSVSTVAFSIAERLGCSPIVLVGQDLAYTDGRTHAAGTPFESSRVTVDVAKGSLEFAYCDEIKQVRSSSQLGAALAREELFMVPAYGGGDAKVASTSSFNSFRGWFEVAAQTLSDSRPDLVLVNATEGGSRIAGYVEKPLAAVLGDLPDAKVEVRTTLSAAEKPYRSDREIDDWLMQLRDKTAHARRVAARLDAACERALRKIQAGSETVTRQFDRIEALERELREATQAQPLLEAWSHEKVRPITASRGAPSHTTDAIDDARWALSAEREVAKAIVTSARELEELLSQSTRPQSTTAANSGTVTSTSPILATP